MLTDFPVRWIVFGIALLVAMQCLMSMATLLRDRLQGLLLSHVKRQQIESKKRNRIQELREAIRAKKEAAKNEDKSRAA